DIPLSLSSSSNNYQTNNNSSELLSPESSLNKNYSSSAQPRCVICFERLLPLPSFSSISSSSSSSSSSSLSSSSSVISLQCCHTFHRTCIVSWFLDRKKNTKPSSCPTCRKIVQNSDSYLKD